MALMLSTATPMAFLTGAAPMPYLNSRTCVAPMMKMTRKQRKQQQVQAGSSTPPGVFPDDLTTGVVVPTGGVTTEAPAEVEPVAPVESSPIASETTTSKLPPIAGSTKAMAAEYSRTTEWNPNRLDVSALPGPIQAQFVPSYLMEPPSYLDGSMAGDVGFDPWGLVALAKPTAATDKFARTAKERDAKMLAMTAEEQKEALAWMRESELKHARLAMLAAAGWPLSELASGPFLQELGTNGRAPSLFNGHLPDFWPFLIVAFAPIAYLEFQNKDSLPGGDYGFDPLGLAGEQKPYGAFPFDAFLGKKTPIDSIRYAKDLEAMKSAEIKNGRLAMMAITGFAVQEFVWGGPVVEQTPFFFGK